MYIKSFNIGTLEIDLYDDGDIMISSDFTVNVLNKEQQLDLIILLQKIAKGEIE